MLRDTFARGQARQRKKQGEEAVVSFLVAWTKSVLLREKRLPLSCQSRVGKSGAVSHNPTFRRDTRKLNSCDEWRAIMLQALQGGRLQQHRKK